MRKIVDINKTKYKFMLLIVALFLTFSGCAKNSCGDAITILDPYEDRDDIFSATADVYNKTIIQFKNEHPEIGFTRKVVRNEDYYGNINSYATMEKGLTDIFVISAAGIKDWIKKGAICNEPEYIYPLSNKKMTIIVYDKKKWDAEGFGKFPDNWLDIINAKSSDIAICEMNGGSLRRTYLTPYAYMCCGNEWITKLNNNNLATPFMAAEFENALDRTKRLCDIALNETDIKISTRALDRFVDGEVSAAVITTDEMYELKEKLLEKAPDRYENLGFSFLPVNIKPDDEERETVKKYMTTIEISTVLVINSKVKESPDKLAKCVKFCEYMSGQAFADNMAEMFGFECENKSDKTYKGDDFVWSDMLQLIGSKDKSGDLYECQNLGLILEPGTIGSIDELLWQWIKEDDYSIEEIANYFQDYYEENCYYRSGSCGTYSCI